MFRWNSGTEFLVSDRRIYCSDKMFGIFLYFVNDSVKSKNFRSISRRRVFKSKVGRCWKRKCLGIYLLATLLGID